MTPHKNQDLLIRTQYYLSRMVGKNFRLVLVGHSDPIYGDYLRLLIKSLGIESTVLIRERVEAAELSALYRGSAAYVSASRHEGYGIPLIEAMRHGLPVFALSNDGVRETLGGAGVLIHTKRPHRLAEIVATVLEDSKAVAAVLSGQEQRLEQVQRSQSRAEAQNRLMEMVTKVMRKGRHPRPAPEARIFS